MRLEAPETHRELPTGLSGATKRKAATGLTEREQKVGLVITEQSSGRMMNVCSSFVLLLLSQHF